MKDNVYNLNQKKKEKSPVKRHNKYIILFIFLIILFIILSFYNGNKIKIFEAKYGEIADDIHTKGLIVRDETLIKTPVSGNVELLQDEGDRVSFGQKIIRVGDKTLYNNSPGIISYARDGLETSLNPVKLNNISVKQYKNFRRNFKQLVNDKHVNKGDNVYRIINNHKLYLLIETSREKGEKFNKGELVFVKPEKENIDMIKSKIKNKFLKEDRVLILISLERFIDDWLNIRWINLSLIKNIYRGVILPESAVFQQSEDDGVLIVSSSGRYNFKEVKIENKINNKVIVSGIDRGEKIVSNPEIIEYGGGYK
ncbi:MAG: HlyD family efflux transporter periplasmic adaptor subunit [bacterium]